jgi:SAM-dependent MidA family methyltransferase
VTARPWAQAWTDALYGPDGFYRKGSGPSSHFRTAAHASSTGLLGSALADLARMCGCRAVVDVGAGRGELLGAVAAADPDLRLVAVEVAARPGDAPSGIAWRETVPDVLDDVLLVGWELLDVVPCDVLEVDDAGVACQVLVDDDGGEHLGEAATRDQLAWCERWWPLDDAAPGDRVEVGATRDAAWVELVSHLRSGLALAVDYGHERGNRPAAGTLTGFRLGRQVLPRPDGSTDVTAHVALDSVAAALAEAFPDGTTTRITQRRALAALGVSGRRPPLDLAATEPHGYLRRLQSAGEGAELLDSAGLGGFGWVLHAVDSPASEGVRRLLAIDGDSTVEAAG